MEFQPWYSKAKPKVSDYNPLVHSPFYNQKQNTSGMGFKSMYQSFYNPDKIDKERSPFAKTAARELSSTLSHQRFYKTRPRDMFSDPITGSTTKLNIPREELGSLGRKRETLKRYASLEVLGNYKQRNLTTDKISGALRKEVPNLGYVNPLALRTAYMLKGNPSINNPNIRN